MRLLAHRVATATESKYLRKSIDLDPLAKRPKLDFSKGIRGKYYERAIAARNIIVLDADLVETFPDSAAVNAALRAIKAVAMRIRKRSRTKAA